MGTGTIGLYPKPGKPDELRIHFPEWKLDGKVLHDVTIFPHLCGTCIGGDHTHVELNDTRAPTRIISGKTVTLSEHHKNIIDSYLRAKLHVFAITAELVAYLEEKSPVARKKLFTDLLQNQ